MPSKAHGAARWTSLLLLVSAACSPTVTRPRTHPHSSGSHRPFAGWDRAALQRFLRTRPASPHAGWALLRLGEGYQRERRYRDAAQAFRKALGSRVAACRARAHLGLGQSLRALGRAAPALATLMAGWRAARAGPLRRALQRELLRVWAIHGRPAQAWTFVSRVTGRHTGRRKALFLALARWHHDRGEHRAGAPLWEEALKRWPTDRRRCGWWQRALLGRRMGLHHGRLARLLGQAHRVLPSRKLSRRHKSFAVCRKAAELELRRLATQQHAFGLRHRNQQALETARIAYEVHQTAFPRARHAFLLAAQHADLLWYSLQRWNVQRGVAWRTVARALDRVVRLPPPTSKDTKAYTRRHEDLALSAIRAWMKVVPTDQPKGKARKVSARPRRLSADEKRLAAALRTYLKIARPRSQYREPVQLQLGRLLWRSNRLRGALKLLEPLALRHRRHLPETAKQAALLSLRIHRALGQHRKANRLLDRLLAHRRIYYDWHFRQQLHRRKVEALRREAAALQRRGRWRACGERYAKITRWAVGKHKDRAWLRAARCLVRAGQLRPAVRALSRLVWRTRSPHGPQATRLLAQLHQRLGNRSSAATYYEQYVNRYPERTDAPATHLKALTLRARLGDRRKFRRELQELLARYGQTHPRIAGEARWLRIAHATALRDRHRLDARLTRWRQRHAKTGLADLHAQATARLATRLWRRSCRVATTGDRCLAAPVKGRSGTTRRPLLRRSAALVHRARALARQVVAPRSLSRFMVKLGPWLPVDPARQRRFGQALAQARQLLAALGRYRRCLRRWRCRTGRLPLLRPRKK